MYVNGGRTPVGRDAVAWAREGVERGAGEILLTSMDRDGTEDGYELELTRAVVGRRGRAGDRIGRGRHARPPGGGGPRRRRRRRALRVDLPLRPVTRCARPRSTCARRACPSGCERPARPARARAPRFRAWGSCCRRWSTCRRSTSWAAPCASRAGDRRAARRASTWRWRATPARRRRTIAARLGGRVARVRAVRHRDGAARRGSSSTWPRPAARPTPEPGALPRVEHAPLAEDLGAARLRRERDGVGLRGDDLGHLYDPLGGWRTRSRG